ncbi:MAG TPA: hypothetical protein V6D48_17150 [Oculatellaceae cyanobacterium]
MGLTTVQDKLRQAIDRYHAADTSRKQSAAKGAITRLVNERASLVGAAAARTEALEAIKSVESGISFWIKERFTPGSFYKEGDRIMGWWDGSLQVQAEELPLYFSGASYLVSFYRREKDAWLWRQRGFDVAEPLPLKPPLFPVAGLEVSFPVERSQFWIEYGYALPCSLQWRWNPGEYYVYRSIISAGFWCAYKWWAGCQWWYYERHPEWFSDSPMWGTWEEKPIFYYAPEPDSAVLGGKR